MSAYYHGVIPSGIAAGDGVEVSLGRAGRLASRLPCKGFIHLDRAAPRRPRNSCATPFSLSPYSSLLYDDGPLRPAVRKGLGER